MVLSEGVQLCNSDNVFFFFFFFFFFFQLIREEGIQIPLKTDHHGHAVTLPGISFSSDCLWVESHFLCFITVC